MAEIQTKGYRKSKENEAIGTKVAEYSEDGPFHCEDCVYRDGDKCFEEHMMRDGEVKHDDKGWAIINIEKGCCRYVRPPRGKE